VYTKKQAIIIATGFSTVAATIKLVVASTLDLMDQWTIFFVSALLTTYIVTAISIYLPPIRWAKDDYVDGTSKSDKKWVRAKGNLLKRAWDEALSSVGKKDHFFKMSAKSFLMGLQLTADFLPSILSIGTVGLLLVEYTPFFDIIAYLFFPVSFVVGHGQAMELSRSVSTSLVEMLLPAILASNLSLSLRYIVGVSSVASILFFSATIPCIKATSIPIKVNELILIWFIRVNLAILISGIFAHFLF